MSTPHEETAGNENDGTAKERRGFGDVMSEIFMPILPALIGAGILQGIISILTSTGLLTEGQPFHFVLSTISSSVFYFLPFLLGVSTARAFKTNPYLAIGVVAFFLAPEMVALMEGDRDLALFGIPVVQTTYTSAVIPIILMIWGMSFIDRGVRRIIPDLLKTVLVPPIVLVVTCVAGLLIMGPIGAALTEAVTWVVTTLNGLASWIIPVVIGAFGSVLVAVGLSFALFPIAIESLVAQGYDGVYGPGMLASNFALAGMCLAVAIKAKNRDYQAFTYSASATVALGVVQPALYGVAVPLRRPFLAVFVGGGAGGLVAGLTGFKVYAMMPAGITALPAWFDEGGLSNPLKAVAVMVTAFVISFIVAWFVGYEQPDDRTVADLTADS